MKTTARFEQALKKLYLAFHNNRLHPECCKQCAVGNILDNTDSWKHLSDAHGSLKLNYVGRVHQNLGRTFNGYTPLELLKIEQEFLEACGFKLPLHYTNEKPKSPTDKDILFEGLTAVISYLCKLEAIDNVMDYTVLFEFKNTPFKARLEFY
ncbi:Na(+)-translocating NADH-quinone reductase subunit F [Tamlana sp. 2201CG12-4]|uniref:Na(+)-translocating NADH-quinone reductase subunit F n=1 Tax=Tamlana sp. 2201CG12-4 TaxID=3112582 RepID=UPI002DBE1AB0|nr:Na(+)-translocating NADH-quinone reductase subunit F [Tamlana sp. 2201CG12-4]MEC3905502.1 Na(+)-translocating NADH-quinone reductase subunit F [Tamlana sp. 2201CG12-4]